MCCYGLNQYFCDIMQVYNSDNDTPKYKVATRKTIFISWMYIPLIDTPIWCKTSLYGKVLSKVNQWINTLIRRPNFSQTHTVASSKNRVWTTSLWKLGPTYQHIVAPMSYVTLFRGGLLQLTFSDLKQVILFQTRQKRYQTVPFSVYIHNLMFVFHLGKYSENSLSTL